MRNLVRHSIVIALCAAGLTVAVASPAIAANGNIVGGVKYAGPPATDVNTPAIYVTTLDGATTFTGTGNASGHYNMSVPPGFYCVSFAAAVGQPASASYPAQKSCLDNAAAVEVQSGLTRNNIDGLLHLGSITGVVRNTATTPQAGFSVGGFRVGGNDVSSGTSTTSTGVYTLKNVLPGTYCLSAQGNSARSLDAANGPCPTLTKLVTVPDGLTPTSVDFVVGQSGANPTGGVAGKITDANGAPLEGRTVHAIHNGAVVSAAISASDGTYAIIQLAPARYCIETQIEPTAAPVSTAFPDRTSCEDHPTLIDVGASTVTGINIAEKSGGAITGRVTIPGGAGVSAHVSIQDLDHEWQSGGVDSDASGNYQLAGLPSGRYCIKAFDIPGTYSTRAYTSGSTCADATPVTVVAGNVTSGIDIGLVSGGTLSGSVGVPAGQTTAQVQLAIFNVGETGYAQPVVQANGNYTLPGMPPGRYCVRVSGTTLVTQAPGLVDGRCVNPTVTVTSGTTTTVNFTMLLGGSYSGFVVTPDGFAVSTPFATPDSPYFNYLVGDDGSYIIQGLPTGNYCVTAHAFAIYSMDIVYQHAFTCDSGATRVSVTAGANTPSIDFNLAASGEISGTITAPPEGTLTDAVIELHRLDAAQPTVTEETFDDSNGAIPYTYDIEVPAGTYCVLVHTSAASVSASRAFGDKPSCVGATPVVVPVNRTVEQVDITLPEQIFVPLASPQRLVDTRPDGNTVDALEQRAGAVTGGTVREVTVGGRAGVPADAASVALNVTVTEPTAAGFLTVYPCGSTRPLASNVNFVTGQTVPNLVVAKLGTSETQSAGKVCVFTNVTTQIIVDVAGYFPTTDGLTPLDAPQRLVDTRSDGNTVDGAEQRAGAVAGGTVREVTVGGRASVPAGAASAALNVTVTNPAAAGFVTVFPCGSTKPLASNLNFTPGQTVPNFVIAKLGTAGRVCVSSNVTADIVVDVAGYFANTDGLTPLAAPQRLVDTRPDGNTVDSVEQRAGAVAGGVVREVTVGDRAGVPSGATSVALNVTATGPVAAGFLTVFPCGSTPPLASNLNFSPGQTVPNSVISRLGTDGKVCVVTNVSTDLVVDVSGYFPG